MNNEKQSKMRKFAVIVLIATFSAIFGILFASRMNWTDVSIAEDEAMPALDVQYYPVNEEGESPFVAVAEMIKPAVVSISVERTTEYGSPHDMFDFGPFREFFGQPQPNSPRRQQKSTAGGTGIIIGNDGFILTNNHIVEDADKITIRLSDDSEYEAKVIGTDPITDVALVKIKAEFKPEQVARLGDSDKIKIGAWAIAVGNPFGLDWTVTVGVISAKGRGGLNFAGRGPDVQNFIQTDASINFGNSGGPLLNIRGEVIGVNSAINSQGQGIGFAIPINMAKEVVSQLKTEGKVSHGYLGMYPAELTASKKEALGLDNDVHGVFVDQVEQGTPADEGGLEPGDVITEFDGHGITNVTQFRNLVASKRPGEKVSSIILRNGKEKKLEFTLSDRAESVAAFDENKLKSEAWLGINVENLTPMEARRLGIEEDEGVLITRIDAGSPALDILREGDVIIEIDRRTVKDVDDFEKISKDLKDRTKSILFRISRNGRKTFEVIKP